MQEIEKILEEIENTFKENIENIEDENGVHHFVIDSFTATFLAKEIIRKHMDNNNLCEKCSRRKWYQIGYKDGKNDGWIPVEERMPTKEECEKNQTGCIKFWITYGYRGNYSTLLANCKWVEADNEDGTTGDFAEFWVDQYPQIFYPSLNLIRGWKIIEAPDPYRPERGISIQQ